MYHVAVVCETHTVLELFNNVALVADEQYWYAEVAHRGKKMIIR